MKAVAKNILPGAEAELKVLDALLCQEKHRLEAVQKLNQKRLAAKAWKNRADQMEAVEAFPPPNSLYARWQAVLDRLEDKILTLANEIADALEQSGEKNLFDLIAAANSLLDLLDRLHRRAYLIGDHTRRACGLPTGLLREPYEGSIEHLLGHPAPHRENGKAQ